jgi:hypothetical protein
VRPPAASATAVLASNHLLVAGADGRVQSIQTTTGPRIQSGWNDWSAVAELFVRDLICAGRRGPGLACFAVEGARAYPRAMPSGLGAVIDSRLEDLIVACARRRWPHLQVVPARWIRPAVAPTALRLRRLLSRVVLALAMAMGIILVLLKPYL